jgi:hypothetical protein
MRGCATSATATSSQSSPPATVAAVSASAVAVGYGRPAATSRTNRGAALQAASSRSAASAASPLNSASVRPTPRHATGPGGRRWEDAHVLPESDHLDAARGDPAGPDVGSR